MNMDQLRSADGKRSVNLEYIGSMHFGPELYRASFVGFVLPFSANTVYGDIRWSPDGKHLVLIVFHSSRSDQTPESEFVVVTFKDGQARSESRIREPKVIELLEVTSSEAQVLVGNQRVPVSF